MKRLLVAVALAVIASGCASYVWTSSVPAKMRTVQVPTFRNETILTETAPVVTRQILRELQREGTFKIMSDGAAVEIQGTVISAGSIGMNANYRVGSRYSSGTMSIVAKVSVIDKRNGRVLVDNREYSGIAPYASGQDNTTALRDASGRAADDLAQHVVDDLVKMDFPAWRK